MSPDLDLSQLPSSVGPRGRVPRRARLATAVVVVAVALLGAGCSSGGNTEVSASMQSPPRPEQRSELAPDAGELPNELPDDLDDLPGMEEFEDQFGEMPGMEDFEDELDRLMDDVEEQFGGSSDCFRLLMGYSELIGLSFGGPDSSAQREQVLGELRETLPADLVDDLQVVSDALERIAEEGALGSVNALTEQEFMDANEAIATWLSTECS